MALLGKNLIHREIILDGRKICYTLEYKTVKNINLRVKSDGSVLVSANKRVRISDIEVFMLQKSAFILKAINKFTVAKNTQNTAYFSLDELQSFVNSICVSAYPYYKSRNVSYPIIKFRKMKSRWGTCYPTKGMVVFNTNLVYAPRECVEYVVYHELTHFLEPNHKKEFYNELEKVCADYKWRREALKKIIIN